MKKGKFVISMADLEEGLGGEGGTGSSLILGKKQIAEGRKSCRANEKPRPPTYFEFEKASRQATKEKMAMGVIGTES